jgi:hypothetical protein
MKGFDFILADKAFSHLDDIAGVTNLLALYVRCKGFLTNTTTGKETFVDGYAKLNDIEVKQYWESYDEDADLYKPEFLICHGEVAGNDVSSVSDEETHFYKKRSILVDKNNVFVKKGELEVFNKEHGISTELENDELDAGSEYKINNHAERHALNREQILGAAVCILASYPDSCRSKNGTVQATKIREQIEDKAQLFWEETHLPPLSTSVIEDLLRDWLRKTSD